MFNKLVDKYNSNLDGEAYIKVTGTYVGGSENIIRARDIEAVEPSKMILDQDTSPLRISVSEDILDKNNLILLKELLQRHPGNSKVELEVSSEGEVPKLLELKSLGAKVYLFDSITTRENFHIKSFMSKVSLSNYKIYGLHCQFVAINISFKSIKIWEITICK